MDNKFTNAVIGLYCCASDNVKCKKCSYIKYGARCKDELLSDSLSVIDELCKQVNQVDSKQQWAFGRVLKEREDNIQIDSA